MTNPIYVGQVTYKKELHAGEQEAIVEPDVWQKTQDLLAHNCRQRVSPPAVKERALLQGLLRCRNCGRAMTPATSSKKGTRKYRYYVCTSAQARGWNTCPSKSMPAAEIERFVVEQIRAMGQDELGRENPELVALDSTWDDLSPTEQGEIVRSVIAEVAYDGVLKTVKVTVKGSVLRGNELLDEEHAE